MTTPHSPITSRFQIVPGPFLSPGKCMLCGAVDREVLDFSQELNVEGYAYRVYMCILCFRDANTEVEKHLIAKGELESEADRVSAFLEKHNYVVISKELYESLEFWVTGLDGAVSAVASDPLNVSPLFDEEDEQGDSRDDSADSVGEPDDSEGEPRDNLRLDFGEPKDSGKSRPHDLLGFDIGKF